MLKNKCLVNAAADTAHQTDKRSTQESFLQLWMMSVENSNTVANGDALQQINNLLTTHDDSKEVKKEQQMQHHEDSKPVQNTLSTTTAMVQPVLMTASPFLQAHERAQTKTPRNFGKISFNRKKQCFELHCLDEGGVRINGLYFGQYSTVPLHQECELQLGKYITLTFTPPTVMDMKQLQASMPRTTTSPQDLFEQQQALQLQAQEEDASKAGSRKRKRSSAATATVKSSNGSNAQQQQQQQQVAAVATPVQTRSSTNASEQAKEKQQQEKLLLVASAEHQQQEENAMEEEENNEEEQEEMDDNDENEDDNNDDDEDTEESEAMNGPVTLDDPERDLQERPFETYQEMITECLRAKPSHTCSLQGIYSWMSESYAVFASVKRDWHASVRTYLCKSNRFFRVQGNYKPAVVCCEFFCNSNITSMA